MVATDASLVLRQGSFPGLAGELYLRWAFPPEGTKTWARVAIVHGYGDHSGRYAEFMTWLARRGVACHAVDLRGQGQAAGRRGFVRRWDEYLDDLAAFLGQPILQGPGPLFLLGHSHGALVVAAALLRGSGVQGGDVAGCVMASPMLASKMRVPRGKILLGRLLGRLVP